MNPTPDEKKQEGQVQPGSALSDSELEQVSGGTWGENQPIIDDRERTEIEYGEP